jgi:hypothetical protein
MINSDMSQQENAANNNYKRILLILLAGAVIIGLLAYWLKYKIEVRINEAREISIERRITAFERKNAALEKQLDNYSIPIIQAIYKYEKENDEFPKDLHNLVPRYLPEEPYAVFGDKVEYSPNGELGPPFYFGFRGNYSGIALLHGYSYIYCPLINCDNDGTYRIGENWIFVQFGVLSSFLRLIF